MLHLLKLRLTGGVFASEQRDTSAWMSTFNVHFGAFSDNYDDECILPLLRHIWVFTLEMNALPLLRPYLVTLLMSDVAPFAAYNGVNADAAQQFHSFSPQLGEERQLLGVGYHAMGRKVAAWMVDRKGHERHSPVALCLAETPVL